MYLLRVRGGALYCGITNDFRNRMRQHWSGKGSKYVRSRLPFTPVWLFWCGREIAVQSERIIKRLPKQEKERIVRENFCHIESNGKGTCHFAGMRLAPTIDS